MRLSKIRVSNFRSFNDLEVELGDFNVLIGANASGKSNFIEILRFLRDMVRDGLENAISKQGGPEYLTNFGLGPKMPVRLEVVGENQPSVDLGILDSLFVWRTTSEGLKVGLLDYWVGSVSYILSLQFSTGRQNYVIAGDEIVQKAYGLRPFAGGRVIVSGVRDAEWEGLVKWFRQGNQVKVSVNLPEQMGVTDKDLAPPQNQLFVKEQAPLLCQEFGQFHSAGLATFISQGIGIYDFSPSLCKEFHPIAGKAELEEDGRNLALVLRELMRDKEKRQMFSSLLKDLLPFVEDVTVKTIEDRSVLLGLRENYFDGLDTPVFLISDGSVRMIALLVALYFETKPLVVIEEPERNIHPSLISSVVEMMKEVSHQKQLIITTHHPEVVKSAGLENLLMVSRDLDGFSTVTRPEDKKHVKAFLKQEIGLDELFVEDLL